jgi:hypothetical protein
MKGSVVTYLYIMKGSVVTQRHRHEYLYIMKGSVVTQRHRHERVCPKDMSSALFAKGSDLSVKESIYLSRDIFLRRVTN